MKKMVLVMTVAMMSSMLMAQEKTISLADARGQIGAVVSSPTKMTEVISQLSAADQKAFLADVNEAISKMPGSTEEKAAKFVDANTAALKGAKKGNLAELLAEVFATVSPEALTIINESFATGTFNRAADPTKVYTDEQFTTIAKKTMEKIQARNASSDDADVRNTFAILMFVRASNGTPADLRDTLINQLADNENKAVAKNEWIPAALGDNGPKTYDPMLGASDAGEEPNPETVSFLVSPMVIDALLGDLAAGNIGTAGAGSPTLLGAMLNPTQQALPRLGEDSGLDRVPRTLDENSRIYPGSREPSGYAGQTIYDNRAGSGR